MKTAVFTIAVLALLGLTADAKSTLVSPLSQIREMKSFHLQQEEEAAAEGEETEASEEEAPAEEEPSTYEEFAMQYVKPGYWMFVDGAIGLYTGVYGPLMQRARYYDCFGEFFNWSVEFLDWHITYDGWWRIKDPMSWIFFGTNLLAQIFGGYRAVDVCLEQYSFARANYVMQNLLDESLEGGYKFRNKVNATGFDLLFDIVYILAMIDNGLNSYFAVMDMLESGWDNFDYYYHLGHNGALFLTRLITFLDKVVSLGLITPVKPWIRIKTAAGTTTTDTTTTTTT